LKSLEQSKEEIPLQVFCLGKDGVAILESHSIPSKLLDIERLGGFHTFDSKTFIDAVFQKFVIIHAALKTHDFVLFTDGDIVYERAGVIEYLKTNIADNDLLIQNDGTTDAEQRNLCTGFMFIRSSPLTLSMFDPVKQGSVYTSMHGNDQVFFNRFIKPALKYKSLPLNLFPTGFYYYKFYKTLTPFIIHFNWVIGHEKRRKMIEHGKWYI
jgi:hypothetical protein